MPLSAALPLGLALFLGFENLVLNFLSIFEGVYASNIIIINIVALTGVGYLMKLEGFKPWGLGAIKKVSIVYWLLLPMGSILLFLALLYPSNNYDSMTYHMARVAHWI